MTQLRRITAADVTFLERQRASSDEAGEHSWYGHRSAGRLRQAVSDDTVFAEGRGALAIAEDDGSIVGEIT